MSTLATTSIEQIKLLCTQLRLPSVGRNAESLNQLCLRQGESPLAYLGELLQLESDDRFERRAARRLKEAGFPLLKTLEGFDFNRAPHLPESLLRSLAQGEWIDKAEQLIFLGEPGTGKTHLATALGAAAAREGRRVKFTTVAKLANELVEARDALELSRAVARYARVDVLILDELGYVPLSKADAELLFQVLGERQERKSIILTTNLPFSEWPQVFTDPRLCRAVIDRLTHRTHIIETGTESMRLQEARNRQQ